MSSTVKKIIAVVIAAVLVVGIIQLLRDRTHRKRLRISRTMITPGNSITPEHAKVLKLYKKVAKSRDNSHYLCFFAYI